jgi:hypothetical protein
MKERTTVMPLFTLGLPRSGTTYLGNFVHKHLGAFTPAHPLHFGIKESQIFAFMIRYPAFTGTDDFLAFFEAFSSSDYFKLCLVEKDFFYGKRYPGFLDFFFDLMDEAASRAGARCWTTKLSPDFLIDNRRFTLFRDKLRERYGDRVGWIGIRRNYRDFVLSYLQLIKNRKGTASGRLKRSFSYLTNAAFHIHFNTRMKTLINQQHGLLLDFESVIGDESQLAARLDDYLPGLSNPLLFGTTDDYVRNTSFRSAQRVTTLPRAATVFYRMLAGCPFLAGIIVRGHRMLVAKPKPRLKFRLLKQDYYQNELLEELKADGADTSLLEQINSQR